MGKEYQWGQLLILPAKDYKCGYCGREVASNEGYLKANKFGYGNETIYICPKCEQPSFFSFNIGQEPGPIYGDEIADITDKNICAMYEEARKCMTINAYTSAVMCCRKILMQIAILNGAKPGLRFVEYVEFILENHISPKGSEDWVKEIRNVGNEANHEIHLMKKEDAEDLIDFVSSLLRNVFEYPARVGKRKKKMI